MNMHDANQYNVVTHNNEIRKLRKVILGYNRVVYNLVNAAISGDYRDVLCEICPCESCDENPTDECVYQMLRETGQPPTSFFDNDYFNEQEAKRSIAAFFNESDRTLLKTTE